MSERGYIRSPRGGGAPLLLPQHARQMAQQIFGDTRVSCRQLSRKGAFIASRVGFGETVLIDGHVLSLEEHRALRRHEYVHDATLIVNVNTDQITGFNSPFASRRSAVRPFYTGTRSYNVPVIELKDEKWCLAAIHAGLLPKGRSYEDALAVYDAHFAKSAHDSFRVRGLVKARTD